MSKCTTCRKAEAELDTWWDKIRLWFFHRFAQDILDLGQDKFTQGFSDGYKMGFGQGREIEKLEYEMSRGIFKMDKLPKNATAKKLQKLGRR